jgi:pimeloyl-ACP methyl ester carboxylesterase
MDELNADAEPAANASRTGVPNVAAMPARARVLLRAATANDHVARTALISTLTFVFARSLRRNRRAGHAARERERLKFYADIAGGDASAIFQRPERVEVRTTPARGRLDKDGHSELIEFDSGYVALNPMIRAEYAACSNNTTARALHWRHGDGRRPTLCVLHGFGAPHAAINVAAFSLRRLFADGWDVVLFTLPFHGARRSARRLQGIELFSEGVATFNEAVLHAIHDMRALLGHLEAGGASRLAVTGVSLGGYTAALLAAAEPRLDCVIAICPPAKLDPFTGAILPGRLGPALLARAAGFPAEILERATAITKATSYPSVIAKDRLLIIAGIGDRICPPAQTLELWEHWHRPALHWFPGAHVWQPGRREYVGAIRRLLARPDGAA